MSCSLLQVRDFRIRRGRYVEITTASSDKGIKLYMVEKLDGETASIVEVATLGSSRTTVHDVSVKELRLAGPHASGISEHDKALWRELVTDFDKGGSDWPAGFDLLPTAPGQWDGAYTPALEGGDDIGLLGRKRADKELSEQFVVVQNSIHNTHHYTNYFHCLIRACAVHSVAVVRNTCIVALDKRN